jgi:hypothetical protein
VIEIGWWSGRVEVGCRCSAQARRLVSGGPKKGPSAAYQPKGPRVTPHTYLRLCSSERETSQVKYRESERLGLRRRDCIYHVSGPTARGETSRCPQIHRASERFFAAVATYRRLEKALLEADIHKHADIASTPQVVGRYADGEVGRRRALWIPAIRRDTCRVRGEHAPASQRLICEYFYVYIHLHPRLLQAPTADSATRT